MIVVDLEATCCDDGSFPKDEMETIEIGAVRIDECGIIDRFCSFVRPVRHPELTEFCVRLTSITQRDVDGALTFPEAFGRFVEWADDDVFGSWGAFDKVQFERDCKFHGIEYPFKGHVNLGKLYQKKYRSKRGHRGAMRHLGLVTEGRHHRGIEDAKNIAKVVPYLDVPGTV